MFKLRSFYRKMLYITFSICVLYYAIVGIYFFTRTQNEIEPEFQVYYDSFLAEAKSRGIDLSNKKIKIYMVDNPVDPKSEFTSLAHCAFFPSPHIEVSKSFWNDKNSLVSKELVLYHELIHCLFFKAHVDDTIHIMNSSLDSPIVSLYQKFKKESLDDVFNEEKYKNSSWFREMINIDQNKSIPFVLLIISIFIFYEIFTKLKKRRNEQ